MLHLGTKTKLNIQLDAKVLGGGRLSALGGGRLSTPYRNLGYVVPS